MKPLTIIKIGGNVIDNSENLHKFLESFVRLPGDKILVHGGGKVATELGDSLGIEAKMVEGRRITDIETLRIVTMVYAGLINKNIVAQLQFRKCNAIGMTGADANILRTVKRPVIPPPRGQGVDYGFVGDIHETSIASHTISKILNDGLVPVLCAITHDGNGQLLNTNADTIASAIAVAMSKHYETSLIYCFEKKGVLKDVEDEGSVVREIRSSEFDGLKQDGIIAGGMIPKLHNAFEAIKNGVKEVYIGKADELSELNGREFGTRLIK